MRIEIRPKTVLKYVAVIIVGLFMAHTVALILKFQRAGFIGKVLHRFFDLNTEANIPTLFATLLLLTASVLLVYIHRAQKGEKKLLGHWSLLSLAFLFLTIDENTSLHEGLIGMLRRSFGFEGYLYYSWILPYGLFLVLAFLYYLPFLRNLPPKILRLFLISGFLYLGGAMGMEMLGGRQDFLYGRSNVLYSILYTIEEVMEMLGIALFIYGLLRYIAREEESKSLKILIRTPPRPPGSDSL